MNITIKRIVSAMLILLCVIMPPDRKAYAGELNYVNKEADKDADKEVIQLNALSACLMDAENMRVLYEKNGYEKRAMASTTKIMTLIITLENGNLEDIVTVSKNAARQPDVQLNINTGERYRLGDLVYAMMLESHNDVAVAIAEHIGGSVENFAVLMNEKAKSLGCKDTHFVTPNGLDGVDEGGEHCTTAVDLGRIAAYAIKNEEFVKITNTRQYSFSDVDNKRCFSINNKDAFLDQMSGAIGIKTGYTGKAGYCFVGALKQEGRVFISVVLASGWPPNKSYKWSDTKKLMNYGINNYFDTKVYEGGIVGKIEAVNGIDDKIYLYCRGEKNMLLSDKDEVKVYYEYPKSLEAPVDTGMKVGNVYIYVNNVCMDIFPIYICNEVKKINFKYLFFYIVKKYLL